jgi:hypothetical protein
MNPILRCHTLDAFIHQIQLSAEALHAASTSAFLVPFPLFRHVLQLVCSNLDFLHADMQEMIDLRERVCMWIKKLQIKKYPVHFYSHVLMEYTQNHEFPFRISLKGATYSNINSSDECCRNALLT